MTLRSLAFIWLTRGQKPRRDVFLKEKNRTEEVLDELNYQFMCRLGKESLISLGELYIDGTKIEVNTSGYMFVQWDSPNYHLIGLLDAIDALYTKYNTFLLENEYDPKCNLGNVRMLMVEGMGKIPVRNDPFPDSPLFYILGNLRENLDIRQVQRYHEDHKRGNASHNISNRR